MFTLFLICHKAALNPFSPLLQIWEKHREIHWNYAGLRINISSDVRTHLVDTSFRTQSFRWHLYSVKAIGAINFTMYWNMDSLTNQRENFTVKRSKELSVLPPQSRLKMRAILFQKNQFPKTYVLNWRWVDKGDFRDMGKRKPNVATAAAESRRGAASNPSITALCQPWNWIKSHIIYKWTPYFCLVQSSWAEWITQFHSTDQFCCCLWGYWTVNIFCWLVLPVCNLKAIFYLKIKM